MPPAQASHYAQTLQMVARERSLDPLLMAAIIHHESGWQPEVISDDGEDYGLGQIRARFLPACRGDEDPLNAPSDACAEAKLRLLDGDENIRRVGAVLADNRAFCKARTGKDAPERYLAGYQGLNRPSQGRYCVPGEITRTVIAYKRTIEAELLPSNKRPSRKAKAAPPAASARVAATKTTKQPATPSQKARPSRKPAR